MRAGLRVVVRMGLLLRWLLADARARSCEVLREVVVGVADDENSAGAECKKKPGKHQAIPQDRCKPAARAHPSHDEAPARRHPSWPGLRLVGALVAPGRQRLVAPRCVPVTSKA